MEVMNDVDCPFGIFLDLYVLDNVADNPVLYQIQSWTAWFWSKLMILRAIPRPTLQQRGIKAKLIWAVCGMVYKAMKLLHISPQWLRMRCERVCRKYNKYRTRRMAFLPDTSPYWNVVDRTRCYPLRKLEFEGRRMNFPGNIEEMLTNMYGDFMSFRRLRAQNTHTEPAGIFKGRDTVVIKYLANALIGGDGQIEKRNMSWNMIGSFLYALASMVLTIAVIQIVGEDEGGIFSFAYSTFGQHMFRDAYFWLRPFQITIRGGGFTFGDICGCA